MTDAEAKPGHSARVKNTTISFCQSNQHIYDLLKHK